MWTRWGVKKTETFADVINGCSLTIIYSIEFTWNNILTLFARIPRLPFLCHSHTMPLQPFQGIQTSSKVFGHLVTLFYDNCNNWLYAPETISLPRGFYYKQKNSNFPQRGTVRHFFCEFILLQLSEIYFPIHNVTVSKTPYSWG